MKSICLLIVSAKLYLYPSPYKRGVAQPPCGMDYSDLQPL